MKETREHATPRSRAARPEETSEVGNTQRLSAVPLALAMILTLGLMLAVMGRVAPVAASTSGGAVVRCDPTTLEGPVGAPLEVDIYVENVAELYGADVQMTFDPALAQARDAEPDTPGVQVEPLNTFLWPDFTLRNEVSNEAGTLWYAATQLNPRPPVTGSGPLARITLDPQSAGTLTLAFTSAELATREGTTIPSTTHDCTIVLWTPQLLYLPITSRLQ